MAEQPTKKRRLSETEALVLENESFRLHLRRLGFSRDDLNPMETLKVILNAQRRLGVVWTHEQITKEGFFKDKLVEDDFKIEERVFIFYSNLSLGCKLPWAIHFQ